MSTNPNVTLFLIIFSVLSTVSGWAIVSIAIYHKLIIPDKMIDRLNDMWIVGSILLVAGSILCIKLCFQVYKMTSRSRNSTRMDNHPDNVIHSVSPPPAYFNAWKFPRISISVVECENKPKTESKNQTANVCQMIPETPPPNYNDALKKLDASSLSSSSTHNDIPVYLTIETHDTIDTKL